MNMLINEATRISFEIDRRAKIPAGKVCRLDEQDGGVTVLIRRGEARSNFCRTMTALHQQIQDADGPWGQTWDDGQRGSRVDESPQGLGLAECVWKIVSPARLPRGVDCLPLETPGRLVWAIRAGCASARLCDEMNAYMVRVVGDGLWVQRWATDGFRLN